VEQARRMASKPPVPRRQNIVNKAQELLQEHAPRYLKGGSLSQKRKVTSEVEWSSTVKHAEIWEGQIHTKQSSKQFSDYLSEHYLRKFDVKKHPSMMVDEKSLLLVELEHDLTPQQKRLFAKLQANYNKMVYRKVWETMKREMKRDRTIVNKYRASENPKLTGNSFGISQPGSDRLELLLLRGVLSQDGHVGLLVLATLHILGSVQGWMKSCQAEGKIYPDKLRFALKRPEILTGYGVQVEDIQKIEISTKGGSATCYYYNVHKELKSFQIGVFLARNTFKPRSKATSLEQLKSIATGSGYEDFSFYIERYFNEVESIFLQYSEWFVKPATLCAIRKDEKHKWLDKMFVASNIITDRNSRLANHQDPNSFLPALLACCNPHSKRPWVDEDSEHEWHGGGLLYTDGSFVLHYSGRDVIMMNGKRQHAVLPLCPKKGARNTIRHSMVHFFRHTFGLDDEHQLE
jgi:hypothetical protein